MASGVAVWAGAAPLNESVLTREKADADGVFCAETVVVDVGDVEVDAGIDVEICGAAEACGASEGVVEITGVDATGFEVGI